jgi:hypothetical protein
MQKGPSQKSNENLFNTNKSAVTGSEIVDDYEDVFEEAEQQSDLY